MASEPPQNGTLDSLLEATGRAVAPVARAGWRGARGVALRRGVRRAARQIDTVLERAVRRLLRRPQRDGRPIYAGAFSRMLALAIDAGVVYGSLLLITAAN